MGTTKIKENRFIALPNRRDRVGLQLLKESLAANGKPTYNQFVFEFMLKATLEATLKRSVHRQTWGPHRVSKWQKTSKLTAKPAMPCARALNEVSQNVSRPPRR